MNKIQEIKQKVAALIEEKGLNANSVSLQIGYERTYLKQFLTKENPKRLSERARKALSIILEVPEQELTDEDLSLRDLLPFSLVGATKMSEGLIKMLGGSKKKTHANISIVDVTACCGNGVDNFQETLLGEISIPLEQFKSITTTAPENIKLIKAVGDSMDPTIKDGDMVWIDTANYFISSDGIYLLRMPTGLAIKRVQAGFNNISIKSDNPKYSDITADIGEIKVIGKVVYIWNGRKV